MNLLRIFPIISWISLPTVMFGGYALLRLIGEERLTPFRHTYFRAGHAHAGVLLILSLVYYQYLERTNLSDGVKLAASAAFVVGVLAQSGGFFLHMAIGQPGSFSAGNVLTIAGATVLGALCLLLAYGLVTA